MDNENAAQDQINQAFESFKTALEQMLQAEARKSVDGTIDRLSKQSGPFSLQGVEVEVVIRNLSVNAAGNTDEPSARVARRRTTASAPRTTARKERKPAAAPPRAGRGRPDGPVRRAVLEAFAETTGGVLTTEDVRARLTAAGVEASVDNIHQQLRRLVKAGALERAGRGVYKSSSNGNAVAEQ